MLWTLKQLVGIDLHELIRLKQSNRSTWWWYTCICRDWSAWIDTIETLFDCLSLPLTKTGRDWSAWIDTIETKALTVLYPYSSLVEIDLHELIRLKLLNRYCVYWVEISMSGLICMNWYDWNAGFFHESFLRYTSRDWSAWIDTIETILMICRKIGLNMSGLICMNWYDWNISSSAHFIITLFRVGIDLHELIRLKQLVFWADDRYFWWGRDWSAWIDTIETR